MPDIEHVEVSMDDIVEAMCKMVEPIVLKGALPREDCNRYGVDVLYSKSDKALFMLHFVTQDMLEVNFEFDMLELQRQGKPYLESRLALILDQLEKARKERQEASRIELRSVPRETVEPEPKPVAAAVDKVLH